MPESEIYLLDDPLLPEGPFIPLQELQDSIREVDAMIHRDERSGCFFFSSEDKERIGELLDAQHKERTK